MNYKEKFPILNNENKVYLDTAATSQKPEQIIKKIEEYYRNYNGNPGRGSHEFAIKSAELMSSARKSVSKFINSKNSNEIIFTKGTTESINLIAYSYGLENINENDEILLCVSNHHANIVPWQFVVKEKKGILKYVYLDEKGQIDLEDFKNKLTDKTKIVAFSGVVNVTGVIQPIKEITDLAHIKNAVVVLDAAQSILHFRHNVQELDVDFLTFSGHKMFANMGIGVLYGKEKILNKMRPFLYGGDMIEFVTEQDSSYAELPNKFEGGTQNVEGAISLQAAVEFIEEIGFEKIKEIESKLENRLIKEFEKLEFIEMYCIKDVKKVGIVAFNVKGVHSHDVSFILDSYGVSVRSGHHCAQPLMKYLGIPSCCRISFSIYNTEKDIEKVIEALKKVKEIFGL